MCNKKVTHSFSPLPLLNSKFMPLYQLLVWWRIQPSWNEFLKLFWLLEIIWTAAREDLPMALSYSLWIVCLIPKVLIDVNHYCTILPRQSVPSSLISSALSQNFCTLTKQLLVCSGLLFLDFNDHLKYSLSNSSFGFGEIYWFISNFVNSVSRKCFDWFGWTREGYGCCPSRSRAERQ